MFKLFFILTVFLTTVSANEIEVAALSDLSFVEVNIDELENIDNVDSDNPTLLTQTIDYLHYYTYISLRRFSLHIVQPNVQNFHSRAPPIFTS